MNPQVSYEEFAECRFPGDLSCIPAALEKMRDYCRARGMRPDTWNELELAAAEGLNNAVEHGCAGRDSAEVRLRWSWQNDILRVEITDPGNYAPSLTEAKLPEDELSEGGRGAFLMAQLTDRITHSISGQSHVLTLEKKVGTAKWSAADASEMEETIESMAADLSQRYEDLSALFRFAEDLATSKTLPEFLHHSLDRLLELVKGDAAFVCALTPGKDELELIGDALVKLPSLRRRQKLDPKGGMIQEAFLNRKNLTIDDCSTLAPNDPMSHHKGSAYACPIFFRSTALGVLTVTRGARQSYFSAGELGLIRVVTDFLGIVQTMATLQEQRQVQQRAMRELEIAAAIQQSLMPQVFPSSPGYRVFGVCQSAQEVGGDYFDALAVGGEGMLLVIADVMGKGVPAALLATIFRTAVHARLHLAPKPNVLLTEVNHQIASNLAQNDMFITAQIAYLCFETHTLSVANAGHCPLLHCADGGRRVGQLKGGGIPLGIIDGFEYQAQSYPVAVGDRFVFLTDGLYEVENAGDEMLGIDRLAEQISRLTECNATDLCGNVLDFVKHYTGPQPASDDRTLLAVERFQP